MLWWIPNIITRGLVDMAWLFRSFLVSPASLPSATTAPTQEYISSLLDKQRKMLEEDVERTKGKSGEMSAAFGRALASHNAEYVRLVVPDMHGLFRGKMFPARSVNASGEPMIIAGLTFLPSGLPADLPDQSLKGFGNCVMVPVPGRLYRLPASIRRPHNAVIAQALCELHQQNMAPIEEDLRFIARRQLKRLAQHRLEIWSGTEFEFRMYRAKKGEMEGMKGAEPLRMAHENPHMFTTHNLELYETFVVDLERRLRSLHIDIYTMHAECGRGQLEIPLAPVWGINYADNSCLFKMILKDCAQDYGMVASFMTEDSFTEFPNSAHFNHSLWRFSTSSEPRRNAFRSVSRLEPLSDLGRHWLGGLLHHAKALAAVCCPTVNCYRRIGQPWVPDAINWGFDNRFAAFRVKVGKESNTYLESRLPSSAANPYLVLAATVAAGLDGIERCLEPPPAMDETLGHLPRTLDVALKALEADDTLRTALGERFVSWFVAAKRMEMKDLAQVDVSKQKKADLDLEKSFYQFFL